MLNRAPSVPNLSNTQGSSQKPNPLLTGYGALRNNRVSGAQPTYAPTSNLLKDFSFNKQAQNGGPVGEVDSSKAHNNGQLHSKLEIDPFALTSWALFHPTKTELESVGRHRVPNFGPNPTSP